MDFGGVSMHASEAVRWGLLIGAIAEAAVIAILAWRKVPVWRVCIGQDERLSTSKTIPAVWTLVVGAMLLALVYAYVTGHHTPLEATNEAGVVGQYALLFGGPLGAAILAKQIVTSQTSKNPGVKPEGDGAKLSDLVSDDKEDPELGDLQYVLFNAIALIFVLASILADPAKGIPHLPDVLLGLTSVSAVGYVGKKALTPTGFAAASIAPSKGPAGTEVTVGVKGLQPAAQEGGRFWVYFGEGEGVLRVAPVIEGATEIKAPAPAQPPATAKLAVTVVTADGNTVSGGSFTYA
jgi:hypothetical protein